MGATVLQVDHLDVAARSRKGVLTPIVKDVSLAIAPGKVLALIGESGSGKTTISLACMGFARAGCVITGGHAMLDGTDMLAIDTTARRRLRGADVSYVAQSAAASFNAALRINTQVIETPVIKNLLSEQQARAKAISLYRELDLPDPEHIGERFPHQVSGGQLQRLMAAMAMICDPRLLILDEPTTALDVTTQIEVLQSFKRLIRDRHTSAIYVSHDLAVVAQLADDILVLKDGEMVEFGPAEQIVNAPSQSYTKDLIAAAHVMPKSLPPARSTPSGRAAGAPVLSVDAVTAGYGPGQQFLALRDVSIALEESRTLGIIGESGSGKTTLGRVIAGLMPPRSGEVRLAGKSLAGPLARRSREELRSIQFAFQMADVALNPRHRISKIIGRPLAFYFGMRGKALARRVEELLELVELPSSYVSRYPRELSGGQRQRINLARALAADPKVIICDEITSALDTIVAATILDLLHQLQERLKVAYIFITHDISIIARIADTVAVMREGEVVEQGTTRQVLTPPHHAYTQLLLDSVPDLRTDWLDDIMAGRLASAPADLPVP